MSDEVEHTIEEIFRCVRAQQTGYAAGRCGGCGELFDTAPLAEQLRAAHAGADGMTRSRPKRPRSKSGSSLEAVTAAIAGLVPKCIAKIVGLANGPLILMACPEAAGCPRCDGARRRRRSPDVRPASKPTPSADTTTSPKDVDGRIE